MIPYFSSARVMLILLVACTPPNSQGSREVQETPAPLEAKLRLVPGETLPNLPVAIEIEITNTSAAPIDVFYAYHRDLGLVRLFVTGPDGVKGRLPGLGDAEVPSRKLAPGETLRSKDWILWIRGREGGPGTYWVEANMPLPGPEREVVGPVSFEVREPEGKLAEAAGVYLSGSVLGIMPGQRYEMDLSPETRKRLEILSTKYRDTVYGKYARYFLAHVEASKTVRQWRLKRERIPDESKDLRLDIERAVQILLDLRSDDPPENIRDEIELELASFYLRLGEATKAMAHLDLLDAEKIPYPLSETYATLHRVASERIKQQASGH